MSIALIRSSVSVGWWLVLCPAIQVVHSKLFPASKRHRSKRICSAVKRCRCQHGKRSYFPRRLLLPFAIFHLPFSIWRSVDFDFCALSPDAWQRYAGSDGPVVGMSDMSHHPPAESYPTDTRVSTERFATLLTSFLVGRVQKRLLISGTCV